MTVTEIAVIVAAVLVGSLVKSVTGMGFPIIAVPIMSLYTGPATAIAVIAIPNAAQNLGIAWSHRRALPETKGLAVFCGVGVLGAVANPAFTLALLLVREITPREAASDWIGQVAGGVIGGLVIFGIDDLTRSPVGSNRLSVMSLSPS